MTHSFEKIPPGSVHEKPYLTVTEIHRRLSEWIEAGMGDVVLTLGPTKMYGKEQGFTQMIAMSQIAANECMLVDPPFAAILTDHIVVI